MRIRAFFERFWLCDQGQDLIEYTLMAGFVAVAYGAIMPDAAGSISTVFSKVAALMGRQVMMDPSIIRIICAVLAVVFLGIIVLRRKKSADD